MEEDLVQILATSIIEMSKQFIIKMYCFMQRLGKISHLFSDNDDNIITYAIQVENKRIGKQAYIILRLILLYLL